MAKKENMFTGGTPNFDEKTGTKIPRMSPPLKEKLTRLSPGVYRDAGGKLVGQRGQKLPRPAAPSPIQSILDYYGAKPTGPSVGESLANSRPLRPDEREGRGIDPKDPNSYSVMPDGDLMGTLMGWYKNPGEAERSILGARLGAGSMTPQIPTANSISDLLRRRG